MDLQALVIEYEISDVKQYLKRLQEEKNSSRGVNIIPASNDDLLRMFGGKKKKEVS
jgi:hypothetical protein